MRYLALLVLLVSAPTLIYINFDMAKGVDQLAQRVKNEWPYFKLSDGHLLVQSKEPFMFVNPDGTATVIDTRSDTDYSLIMNVYPTVNYVFTRNQILYRINGQNRIIDYASFKWLTFTKGNLVSIMQNFRWLSLLIIVLAFPALYLFKLLEALVGALAAMLIALFIQNRLAYEQAFQISVYALTLPFIIQGLQKALWPLPYPYPAILFYAVFLIYLIISVRGATRNPIML